MSSRGMAGVVNTIAGMLEDFDNWKTITDMPTDEGVSVDYQVQFIYVGPDGKPYRTTREEVTSTGTEGQGPPPGRYEIHVLDSNGKDLVEPFVAEHITYEMMTRRRPEDSISSAVSAAMSDLETTIRNQRTRLNDAEKREEKYRQERNTVLDQNAKLMRDKAMLELRTQKAEGDAEAAREDAKLLRDELTQLREETAMFRPHAAMLVNEGMQWLAQALGFPGANSNLLPSANDGNTASMAGDPMPVGVGAEDPLALFNKFFAATLANPYFCQWLIERSLTGDISPPISWHDVRALFWANTKCDLGASPDWERMIAEYEAERTPAAAE